MKGRDKMSTRANIIIKDNDGQLWFYRHLDGYPEGAMPTLQKFMGWVRRGLIRNNVGQASGWLILIGAKEYDYKFVYTKGKTKRVHKATLTEPEAGDEIMDWKCGAYEPTDRGRHGDIEYLYVLDLTKKEILCYAADSQGYEDEQTNGKRPNAVWPTDKLLFSDTATNPWVAEKS
jgi:hypothetical protein